MGITVIQTKSLKANYQIVVHILKIETLLTKSLKLFQLPEEIDKMSYRITPNYDWH